MPELPEVETVLQGLIPSMRGHRMDQVEVNRPNLRWPFPENMAQRLKGQDVLQMRRRSKYILMDLSSKETLLVHLGMSGRMTVSGDPLGQFEHNHPKTQKHDHVVFHMGNGARITFNDPRRFGLMDLFPTKLGENHKLLKDLGPEPLGNAFNDSTLIEGFANKKTPVKNALLDQKILCGLGNIYVCEALFRAGISPQSPAKDLSKHQISQLVVIIRQVLEAAIHAGGSSLKDFRQASGELGYFQHSFDVYGREGQDCRRKGCTGKVTRISQSGRSTFYCPSCQS